MKKFFALFSVVTLILTMSITVGCSKAEKKLVSKATVVSAGDLLISARICKNSLDDKGNYNFDYIFENMGSFVSDADYAVVNLETCIAGEEMGYSGFPRFNTPQTIIDAAKKCGFDMFLTASNHTYDMGTPAISHKIDCLNQAGVDYVGTSKSADEENNYTIVNVNGIKIGMFNWTKESPASVKGNRLINGIDVPEDAIGLISTFNYKELKSFYQSVREDIKQMRAEGVDVITAYPHWGREYITKSYINAAASEKTDREQRIAKKLCELGVDVIIGGHPHVVQPVEVIEAANGNRAVCIYSTGNFISSMTENMGKTSHDEYTEDGVLFKYEVRKYDDGSCEVSSVDALPLWVNRVWVDGKRHYTTLPLPDISACENIPGKYNNSTENTGALQSYKRSHSLVDKGIKTYNSGKKIVNK